MLDEGRGELGVGTNGVEIWVWGPVGWRFGYGVQWGGNLGMGTSEWWRFGCGTSEWWMFVLRY